MKIHFTDDLRQPKVYCGRPWKKRTNVIGGVTCQSCAETTRYAALAIKATLAMGWTPKFETDKDRISSYINTQPLASRSSE